MPLASVLAYYVRQSSLQVAEAPHVRHHRHEHERRQHRGHRHGFVKLKEDRAEEELDLPDVGVDQAGAARLLQAVRRNGELARLDLRRNELPPKVVKMLAKQARGFRKESDDDVPLELLLEPQEKSAAQ